MTNPGTEIINLLVMNSMLHYPVILAVEVFITFIEYQYYKKVLKTEEVGPLFLAIINNVGSYMVGILFNLGGTI